MKQLGLDECSRCGRPLGWEGLNAGEHMCCWCLDERETERREALEEEETDETE